MAEAAEDNRVLPGATAAAAVSVSHALLSRWRDKGWLDPETGVRKFLKVAGFTSSGRPLYRLGDVRQAEKETWQSRKSHRVSV